MTAKSIKVVHAALDELGDTLVLRGVIDPGSLALLQVAEYQRETLSEPKIARLKRAIRTGRVPDIDLGMRGERFQERNGAVYLHDQVFIVDGLQRVTAGLRLLTGNLEAVPPELPFKPHLGAVIHINTDEAWERERFEALNLGQTKLSPNVTLRNQRHKFPAAELLWGLAHDSNFALCDRVTWSQNNRRVELITATMLFRAAGRLHSHVGPGNYTSVIALCEGLQLIMDKLGSAVFEANIRTFFDTIETCWGIRQVAYSEGAVHLRSTFLQALARIFSDHANFWQGQRLAVPMVYTRKLSQFPITDPSVMSLASASGKAEAILRATILEELNKGRNQLRPRPNTRLYEGNETEG